MELSPRARAVIDLERCWWNRQGSKDSQIRTRLALSPSSYYRLLGSLVDDPAALAYDPLTVKRLRKRRDQRRRVRVEGRRADPGRR